MEASVAEQFRPIRAPRISGITSVTNAPYLLPHIRELKPTSAIDYGCGTSRLADVLRHAGVTRVARYDPAIPAFSRRPQGFYDLLLSIDVLDHVAEEQIDSTVADMANLARQAIIVVDTAPREMVREDGSIAPTTAHPAEWWYSRLRQNFTHLEPIRVRSRRRAAFRTWPSAVSARPKLWLTFFNEESRYRMAKLGFGRS
jgi:hypothetical protein